MKIRLKNSLIYVGRITSGLYAARNGPVERRLILQELENGIFEDVPMISHR